MGRPSGSTLTLCPAQTAGSGSRSRPTRFCRSAGNTARGPSSRSAGLSDHSGRTRLTPPRMSTPWRSSVPATACRASRSSSRPRSASPSRTSTRWPTCCGACLARSSSSGQGPARCSHKTARYTAHRPLPPLPLLPAPHMATVRHRQVPILDSSLSLMRDTLQEAGVGDRCGFDVALAATASQRAQARVVDCSFWLSRVVRVMPRRLAGLGRRLCCCMRESVSSRTGEMEPLVEIEIVPDR
mmetsp:Transcript_47520/g.158407  ORF Transcript_47520/g.158407 Transcript_47520/m.158407 type:complete len:241 (+) Transcript_47520:437-1159(+)